MSCEKKTTGRPSEDRRWMQYYPDMMLELIKRPNCTVWEYLEQHCPGPDVVAIHYYGEDITWRTVFEESEKCARSLRAMGFGEGDQIPVFFRLVPNFVFLLLAAEKIGASILCRDNTLIENVEAVSKADAKAIFAHDFLSQKELRTYCEGAGVRKVILLDPMYYGHESTLPDYIKASLDEIYPRVTASGENTMSWDEFLSLGNYYVGRVEADRDLTRPLVPCLYKWIHRPVQAGYPLCEQYSRHRMSDELLRRIRPDPSDLDGDMPSACTGSSCGFHGNASAVIQ